LNNLLYVITSRNSVDLSDLEQRAYLYYGYYAEYYTQKGE